MVFVYRIYWSVGNSPQGGLMYQSINQSITITICRCFQEMIILVKFHPELRFFLFVCCPVEWLLYFLLRTILRLYLCPIRTIFTGQGKMASRTVIHKIKTTFLTIEIWRRFNGEKIISGNPGQISEVWPGLPLMIFSPLNGNTLLLKNILSPPPKTAFP